MTTIEWNDFNSYALGGVGEALDAAGVDTSAPEYTVESSPAPGLVEVDAGLIAQGLGLAPEKVPAMVADRRIATLCERGTGDEEGLFRFTFYYAGQRLRLITDAMGRPLTR